MKILLVQNMIYVPTHGGASKANRLLLEGLAAKGHSCRVVVPAFGTQVSVKTQAQFLAELDARGIRLTSASSEVAVFQYNGVEVHAVTERSRLHNYVAGQVREFESTWTLVSDDDPGQLMLEAALEANHSRVVYLVHTPQALPFGPKGFLQNRAKADLVRQTAGIITVSNHIKDYIKQWSELDSVALAFPVYGSGPFPDLGCFDKGFVTLINPCAVKGISIFLELARRMPDIQFAGVPTWGTTRADRTALEQLSNVRLLPPTDNIDEIFRQTRVLLMPSLWTENFPLTVTEAMLRGIPVIGSNSGGLPETKREVDYVIPVRLIEQYEDRFDDLGNPVPVVPDQDVDPWEETLRKLLSDHAVYEQLSAASREAALRFVSSVGVEPFENYLENLQPASQVKHGDTSTRVERQAAKTSDLHSSLSKLSSERLELLARRLKKKGESVPKTTQTISRRTEASSAPLSFAQQRLWFIDQLEPGNPAYNNLDAFRLTDRLNVAALERTTSEIVKRHEALRTTFPTVDGQPVQIISQTLSVPLRVTDLSHLPAVGREAEAERLVREEAQRPFDLAQGPLLRTTLLRLGEEDHILLLAMHHIVSDGWSGGVLFQEITALYEAFSTGKPAPLPELPVQYADYAVWQRGWLQGEVLEKQLSYWRERLSGAPPVLELPTDHPRPAVQSFRGARQSVMLSKSLTEALRTLSQREGATLFMILLAAFQTLLRRYSNQEEIVVGSPIAGRTRPETEGLIGLFVNTLVLHTDLSGDPSFRELLGRVREVALGAYAHQDVPFEKLVEELQPKRSLSHTPLFQVMFILQNAPRLALNLSGLTLKSLEFDNGTAQFDVTLSVVEVAEGLQAKFEYNTDLFDAATITRMLKHFQVLLEGVVANPDQRLSELPLLTEAERHQLLIEWNDTAVEYPRDICLHELFEAQVTRTPEAVAVVFEEEQLTYRELNRRANQLARYLRKLGVGPEVLVGIMMERSIEMVVGLLGILKAGGAYVPLDPAYPQERLSFMLEDARVPVLLTQARLAESLPQSEAEVVSVDALREVIAQEGVENPAGGATAENLAYVIYTSGSTGRPKGAMNSHRGICNRLLWMQDAYQLTGADRVLQKTPFSFDVSVWEFFWPLLTGARLVVAQPGGHQDSDYLVKLITEQKITTLHFVPSMLQVFLEGWGLETCDSLKQVMCSGEALPFELQERFFARLNAELHNLYGPTEAAVDVTFWACERESNRRTVPIGRPIANTQIYLLDRRLQPVPVGVPGELYIGGVGVARGYLNRPELTAERFIPDPFSAEDGARLYKTGDLARYLPDGNIEYLGRIDHQVKLRGFRIELGEIEAVLQQYAGVRDVVVLLREDGPGDKRLVAYVAVRGEAAPGPAELRRFLSERLPEYMVPQAFVLLDELPLTPNGKVDRRALPEPDGARPEPGAGYVAPRGAEEEEVARVWAEVLKVERVGADDNFFELGGHSLLVMQVVSRLRRSLGVELPLRSLFEAPTVVGLAEAIKKLKDSGAEPQAPAIVALPRKRHQMNVPLQGLLTVPEGSNKEV